MKKLVEILITLCTLAAGIYFLVNAGPPFLKILGGARPLGPGEDFSQAEGEYISYEVAYPVASRVAEVYSGDQDRARTLGFVVYDEERQAFIYVIVSEQNKGGFENLMWKLQLAAEMRESRDMMPIPVAGTLEPMEKTSVEQIFKALEDSKVMELYSSYGQGVSGDIYFGDAYGQVMAQMGEALEQGWKQTDWYYIEDGSVEGRENYHIWTAVFAGVFSLFLFLCRVFNMFAGGKSPAGEKDFGSGSRMGQLLNAQRGWVEEWCSYGWGRSRRLAYLFGVGCVAALTAVGLLAGGTLPDVLSFHVPLGVLMGELGGIFFWSTQKVKFKPDLILVNLEKHMKKELPSSADQEALAEDIFGAGREWVFQDRGKDDMYYGVVGSRYWVVFSGNGTVCVIDSPRLRRIETEKRSGQMRSGNVKVRYEFYLAQFYYENAVPKKRSDKSLSFPTANGLGQFMTLARKRVGDGVEIVSK